MNITKQHSTPLSDRLHSSNRIDSHINAEVNRFQMAYQPLLETGQEYAVPGLTWETLRTGVKAINAGASANEASILAFGIQLAS